MLALFACAVVAVHDADTLRCATGERVRLAAISARELDGTCNSDVPCPSMPPARATRIVQGVTIGRMLQCRQVGTSYRRIVADCSIDGRSLSCAIVATGAASWWPRYAVQYRMRPCR